MTREAVWKRLESAQLRLQILEQSNMPRTAKGRMDAAIAMDAAKREWLEAHQAWHDVLDAARNSEA